MVIFNSYVKLPEGRIFYHEWIGFVKGKSEPETHGFLPSNIGVSGFNFPIIQFRETQQQIYEIYEPLWPFCKFCHVSHVSRRSMVAMFANSVPSGNLK